MVCLLDTGILLRLADQRDTLHDKVVLSVESLRDREIELVTTTQNLAEFWNVATRPLANNGLALPTQAVLELLGQVIEPICDLLLERGDVYAELKRLARKYSFAGKQVHDVRLVAMMICGQVDTLLTLNERHCAKFAAEGVAIRTPHEIAG